MNPNTDRLYVVLDSNLCAGLKAAQGIHAVCAFKAAYPDVYECWHTESNNIAVLECADLTALADHVEAAGHKVARFHEPDLDDALTAIGIEPAAWKMLSSLPLAHASRERCEWEAEQLAAA